MELVAGGLEGLDITNGRDLHAAHGLVHLAVFLLRILEFVTVHDAAGDQRHEEHAETGENLQDEVLVLRPEVHR